MDAREQHARLSSNDPPFYSQWRCLANGGALANFNNFSMKSCAKRSQNPKYEARLFSVSKTAKQFQSTKSK